MAGETITHVLNMVINIIVARKLAPESYGLYALFLTYVSLFYSISSLGLRRIVIRCIARHQDSSKEYFYVSMIVRCYGLLLAAISFVIYNHFNPVFGSNYLILMVLAGVFLNSFWEGFQNVAFGMERMETTSVINVSMSALLLLIYILIDKSLVTVNLMIGIYVGNYILRDIIYLISLYKQKLVTGSYTFSYATYKEERSLMLRDSFPYYILTLFSLVSTQLPILFLNQNSSITEVSYFNIANKLLLPMTMLIHSAFVALFPNQAKEYDRNKERFVLKVKKILYFISFTGFICCLYITLFRGEIVTILYGEDFRPVSDVLSLQCWYMVFFAIFGFIGNTLGSANKQSWIATLSIIYAIINAPILWIASKYGAVGLSYGYMIGAVINMTYHIVYLQKALPHKIKIVNYLSVFGALTLGVVFSIFVPANDLLIVRIIISIVIFGALLLNRNRLISFIIIK